MKKLTLLILLTAFASFSLYGAANEGQKTRHSGKRCGMQEMQMNMQQMRKMMGNMQGMKDQGQKQNMMQNQMGMMMDNMEMMMSMMHMMQSGKNVKDVECPAGGGMMSMHKGMMK